MSTTSVDLYRNVSWRPRDMLADPPFHVSLLDVDNLRQSQGSSLDAPVSRPDPRREEDIDKYIRSFSVPDFQPRWYSLLASGLIPANLLGVPRPPTSDQHHTRHRSNDSWVIRIFGRLPGEGDLPLHPVMGLFVSLPQ